MTRKSIVPVILTWLFFNICSQTANAQSCIPTNINNTVYNIFCGGSCTSLNFQVPHLKSTSTYIVDSIPFTPFPYIVAMGGTEDVTLYADDRFSGVFSMTFPFCFYDSVHSYVVIGSNGLITFDTTNGNSANAYPITQTIPYAGGSQNVISPAYYPKSSIMGAFSDLDPRTANSPPDKKIQWRVEGTAPCRKFIISFFHIGTFGDDDCTFGTTSGIPSPVTLQIVIYESTSLIDVYIENKTCTPSTNGGNAILGVQNWLRDKAVAAPGKNGTNWSAINEGYRFIPSGGVSRFVSSELLTLSGTFIAFADTATTNAGLLDISFPNICPAATVTQYVIRTTFGSCPAGTNMISLDTITVNKTSALSATTIPAPPTTCNGSNGSLTVTAVAGVAPFTFVLSGPGGPYAPQLSPTFTTTFINLAAGNYSVTITDAGGCTGMVDTTIANYLLLTGTFVPTAVSCPGINDGSLTITPGAGSTGPYTFTLTGPGGPFVQVAAASTTFSGLAGGIYSVTFSNAAGCSGTIGSMLVGAGIAPTASISKVNVSCAGANDGTVTVTPNAGAAGGPYNITLNPGGYVQNGVATSAIFAGLGPNTYTATFTNAAGCTGTTFSVTVFNAAAPTALIVKTNTTCNGANDGTVTVTPNGGVAQGPYNITLNPGGYIQNGVASSATFLNLPPNTYTATFTNAAGCTGTTISVIVSSGPGISSAVSGMNTSCPGVNDGTITVTPNGGAAQGPYNITLNPGGYVQNGVISSATFNGLSPNTYTATFTNSGGCSGTTASLTILPGTPVSGTAVPTPTSCPTVNDGTILVTPGGTGPYIYTLNPGNRIQNNNPLFTGLAPLTYTISFVTGTGCTGNVTINPTVLAGPSLSSTATQFDPPCANINNGSITIIPAGISPFAFVLTGPGGPYNQATPLFNNLAPGTYNYSFTDGSGCTGTGGPVTLITHSPLSINVIQKMPLCNGNANGIITLTAGGGLGPYQYAKAPFATFQATGLFNGLTAGTFSFRIKDFAGCTKDTTITIGEPTSLTATAFNLDSSSCSGNDGTISITGFGGTPNYQYSIDNGLSYQAANLFIAPAPGLYPNIRVKDANGCIANTSTTVTLVDNMFLFIGNDSSICVGSSIVFQPQTNPGTSIYKWRPLDATITMPSTINIDTIRNAIATPVDTAAYILNARWGACSREDTIIINVLHKPVANAGSDTAICNGTFAILRGSASNLSGSVNFLWTPASSVEFDTAFVTVATPDSTQLYTLTVTDNYGCSFSVSDDVLVTVQPLVPAFAGNDTIAIRGVPHQLFGSGGQEYLWSPAAPLNISTAQNPLATLLNDQLFVLKVTDVAGCIGFDTVFVQAYDGPNYYVPNAFSPNGDGLNDVFRPVPVGITSTDWFRVFNRYGQLVFETQQWLKGWDGMYKGKLQPLGVYVWMVKGTDKNGRIVEDKGTVMLVK